MLFTVGRFDRDLPGLAEYVQVGGDEPIGVHDKAGSQALLLAVASGERDDHHGLSGRGGDLLDRLGGRFSFRGGRLLHCGADSNRQQARQTGDEEKSKARHEGAPGTERRQAGLFWQPAEGKAMLSSGS